MSRPARSPRTLQATENQKSTCHTAAVSRLRYFFVFCKWYFCRFCIFMREKVFFLSSTCPKRPIFLSEKAQNRFLRSFRVGFFGRLHKNFDGWQNFRFYSQFCQKMGILMPKTCFFSIFYRFFFTKSLKIVDFSCFGVPTKSCRNAGGRTSRLVEEIAVSLCKSTKKHPFGIG